MEYIYSVLLLNKCGKEVTEENIKKVLTAAGVRVEEAKVRALVSALKDINIEEAIKEAAIVPTVSVAGEAKETKKEEKKHEEEKKDAEEAASGLSSLFG